MNDLRFILLSIWLAALPLPAQELLGQDMGGSGQLFISEEEEAIERLRQVSSGRLPRYLIQINYGKILGDPGPWEAFSHWETLCEAVNERASILNLIRAVRNPDEETLSKLDRWIRIYDQQDSFVVLGGAL